MNKYQNKLTIHQPQTSQINALKPFDQVTFFVSHIDQRREGPRAVWRIQTIRSSTLQIILPDRLLRDHQKIHDSFNTLQRSLGKRNRNVKIV